MAVKDYSTAMVGSFTNEEGKVWQYTRNAQILSHESMTLLLSKKLQCV